MRDIRKYMNLMEGETSMEPTAPRKSLHDYLNESESIEEAPAKSELQIMASKVLPRGAKEDPYTGEMVYTKSGGLDSVATMEEKIIAKLKEQGFTKVPTPGEESVFKLDNWVAKTKVSYGAGYKSASMSAVLSKTDGVAESEELDEGSFVVKSLDGVEKRFKTLGPEATAWENSMSPKRQRQDANTADREQARQEKDEMNATIWSSINGPWEWTELDWIDIAQSFIVPDLISKLKGKPVSRTLKDALIDARNGDLSPLLKVFDSVVRNRKEGSSFSSWANSMSGYGVKEDAEMGDLTLDEAQMSDSRKAVAQFLRSKGWTKSEEGTNRQGRRIWFAQRSPKNDITVTKEEYVVQLLADMNAAGIQGTIGDGYERDSILGSDWKVTVQTDTGKIGLCLSMRDTPDNGLDW